MAMSNGEQGSGGLYSITPDQTKDMPARFGEGDIDVTEGVPDTSNKAIDYAEQGYQNALENGQNPFGDTGYGNGSVTNKYDLYKSGKPTYMTDTFKNATAQQKQMAQGQDQYMRQLQQQQMSAQKNAQGSAKSQLDQQMAQQGVGGTQALIMSQMQERGQAAEETDLLTNMAMTKEERQRKANVDQANMAAQGRGLELQDKTLELQDKWNQLDKELQEKGMDIDARFRNEDNLYRWSALINDAVNSYYQNDAQKTNTDIAKDARFENAISKLDPTSPTFMEDVGNVYENVYGISPDSEAGQKGLQGFDYGKIASAAFNQKEDDIRTELGSTVLIDPSRYWTTPITGEDGTVTGGGFDLFNEDGTLKNPAMSKELAQMYYNAHDGNINGEPISEEDFIKGMAEGKYDESFMSNFRDYSNAELAPMAETQNSRVFKETKRSLDEALMNGSITPERYNTMMEGIAALSAVDLLGGLVPTIENGELVIKDTNGNIVFGGDSMTNGLAEATDGSVVSVGDLGDVTKVSDNEFVVKETGTTYKKDGDSWTQIDSNGVEIKKGEEGFDDNAFKAIAGDLGIGEEDGVSSSVPEDVKVKGGFYTGEDGSLYEYDKATGESIAVSVKDMSAEETMSLLTDGTIDSDSPLYEDTVDSAAQSIGAKMRSGNFGGGITDDELKLLKENEDVYSQIASNSKYAKAVSNSGGGGTNDDNRSEIGGVPTSPGDVFSNGGVLYEVVGSPTAMNYEGYFRTKSNNTSKNHYGQYMQVRDIKTGETYYVLAASTKDKGSDDHSAIHTKDNIPPGGGKTLMVVYGDGTTEQVR